MRARIDHGIHGISASGDVSHNAHQAIGGSFSLLFVQPTAGLDPAYLAVARSANAALEVPLRPGVHGMAEPVGYVVLQHAVRLDRPVPRKVAKMAADGISSEWLKISHHDTEKAAHLWDRAGRLSSV